MLQVQQLPQRRTPTLTRHEVGKRIVDYLVACRKNIEGFDYATARLAAGDRAWLRGLGLNDVERAWTHVFLDQVLESLAMQPPDHHKARQALERARRFWQSPERTGAH